jgi:hypothetical protein
MHAHRDRISLGSGKTTYLDFTSSDVAMALYVMAFPAL